jgi:serine/threonine protein kinase
MVEPQKSMQFQMQNAVHKAPNDMNITNEEFFKQSNCMYFTDEVKVKQIEEMRFVNEFQVLKSIGCGSFSKVKKVIRRSVSKPQDQEGVTDEAIEEECEVAEFAMKIMHKPTLRRERAVRYDTKGEMMMINNMDKVVSEIEIWTTLNHPYISKLFEMIDDEQHDYLYMIIELADMGQIANWDYKTEHYILNQPMFDFVVDHLKLHGGFKEEKSHVEQVAQYLFR